jgi:hypothetical protein
VKTFLESDAMILSPDEQQTLQVIDRVLAATEPHLAGMLRIFARLHADDDAPPAEDLIIAYRTATTSPASKTRTRRRRRPAAPGNAGIMQRATREQGVPEHGTPRRRIRRVGGAMAFFAVPALLLTTLVLVVVFGLSSSIRCRTVPPAGASRTVSVAVPAGSGFAACPAPARSAAKTSAGR